MVALAIFAGVALMLSVLGVYGVMAYAVRQRTQEIGVRVALGASPVTVVRMIVAESLRIAALGVVAGVAGAFVLTRALRGLVFDVRLRIPRRRHWSLSHLSWLAPWHLFFPPCGPKSRPDYSASRRLARLLENSRPLLRRCRHGLLDGAKVGCRPRKGCTVTVQS